jgi:LemA protein
MMWFILILLAVVVIGILWLIATYNRLVTLKNQVKNSWSQIDVQLKRRYDLIPNLIETVKGYMQHERGTLQAVIEARNQASQARKEIESQGGPTEGSLSKLIGAETALRGAMGNIFALAENYPDLKANQTMQRLQEELATTENKVAFSRQAYNDQVMVYNTAQEVFPTNLIAQTFGHHPSDLFEVKEEKVREAPKVSFS